MFELRCHAAQFFFQSLVEVLVHVEIVRLLTDQKLQIIGRVNELVEYEPCLQGVTQLIKLLATDEVLLF